MCLLHNKTLHRLYSILTSCMERAEVGGGRARRHLVVKDSREGWEVLKELSLRLTCSGSSLKSAMLLTLSSLLVVLEDDHLMRGVVHRRNLWLCLEHPIAGLQKESHRCE